jgi:hypothetical protein
VKINATNAEWVLENAKTQMVLKQDVDVEEMIAALEWALNEAVANEQETIAVKARNNDLEDDADALRERGDDAEEALADLRRNLKQIVDDGQRPLDYTFNDILERVRLAVKESER